MAGFYDGYSTPEEATEAYISKLERIATRALETLDSEGYTLNDPETVEWWTKCKAEIQRKRMKQLIDSMDDETITQYAIQKVK